MKDISECTVQWTQKKIEGEEIWIRMHKSNDENKMHLHEKKKQ